MDVQQDTSALTHEKTFQEHGPIKVASLTETVREAMSTTLDDESCPTTPTRHSFAGIGGQKPLPEPSFTPTHPSLVQETNTSSPNGAASEMSYKSELDNQDTEMGEADDVEEGADDDGTDNDSVTSESQRPSKKKKGQRFFCTEYPPCQLSFTRSEHLARHIRKHTGERPFQCHCSRRFSRLDNLRQHAQTVHVNEDIPGDSLAATSTRFQRQIRTDRVRPSSSRSRASTIGSQGGHSRGHSRNLSASSIGSTASSIGVPEDIRRRPQPLAMANEGSAGRGRLSLDTFSGVNVQPGPPAQYYNQSPGGYSTPTSTAFSTGASSPHFQSGLASPTSTISHSSYYNGGRPVSRRLSVPAENNPYRNHAPIYAPGYFSPASSTTSGAYTQNSSGFASPTSSVHSYARRDSETDTEYRRRTWHPSSTSQHAQRPATSGLSYYQTPDQPQPAFSQQAVTASQPTRLPGIESFEFAMPGSAARPNMSPMAETASPRPPTAPRPVDSVLNHGLTKLEITPGGHEQRWQGAPNAPPPHAGPQASSNQAPPASYAAAHHISMPVQPVTPRKNKRNAWYGGPLAPPGPPHISHLLQRPSPEDSSSSEGVPTPSTSQGTEYNPMIYSSSHPLVEMLPPGAILTEEQKTYYNVVQPKPDPVRADSGYQGSTIPYGAPSHTYAVQAGHDPRAAAANYGQQQPQNDMTKLEALVAVATSEGNRAVEHR